MKTKAGIAFEDLYTSENLNLLWIVTPSQVFLEKCATARTIVKNLE